MRNMNCRNVRREIEEAAPGKWLSSNVNNHVLSCVACETLLREQTKLRELVSSLGTIEAPGDFDFRLRARLADEKRRLAHPFSLRSVSFGFRYAAVTAILLMIGSAFIFVSFRNPSGSTQTAGVPQAGTDQKGSGSVVPKATVATTKPEVGGSQIDKGGVVNASLNPPKATTHTPTRRHGTRPELASLPGSGSQGTRDSSSTPAAVIKRDQLAEAYPASAFPIDAGYQSLKVSVNDGRGTSRTISLPTVSFGSQSSLAQSGSPLMASAREAW